MSNLEDPSPKHATALPPVEAPPAPPAAAAGHDIESQTGGETGFGVSEIMRRWRREDRLKKGSLALRGFGLLFSLLTFIVMASNKHGDWKNFDKYEEYRYVLGIAILSTLYTGGQALRQVHELSTGKQVISRRLLEFLNFIGDQDILENGFACLWNGEIRVEISYCQSLLQLSVARKNDTYTYTYICAYLLISAASSAVPLTNRMREGADNVFTDSSAAAISMEFLAFMALALSALISGYKLSNQSYI